MIQLFIKWFVWIDPISVVCAYRRQLLRNKRRQKFYELAAKALARLGSFGKWTFNWWLEWLNQSSKDFSGTIVASHFFIEKNKRLRKKVMFEKERFAAELTIIEMSLACTMKRIDHFLEVHG
ncbi:hypothetical protein HY967_05025 [Candidatus Jorgensenbacteria bacterium]|nr:hypothetical protein [Candidatus Jorgensenbacteria bacterium]